MAFFSTINHQFYTVKGPRITLHCSDGNKEFKPAPSETKQTENADGFVDYLKECTGDDPTLKHWKLKIGQFLARYVLKRTDAYRIKYTLTNLPEGYSLWVHYRGDKYTPRSDAYLYGSRTVHLFRSPAEFFFHAKWLMQGMPVPKTDSAPVQHDEELFGDVLPEDLDDRCMCVYCYKYKFTPNNGQEYISRNYSNYKPKKGKVEERPIQARFEGL
ncbi:hypothetical protein M422DRAFT_777542 [Sphaerobolus stellatus SS14]|nr:hypothetical protein M422DRAFT_777542 [Sphaerobolus stellatus SS14]